MEIPNQEINYDHLYIVGVQEVKEYTLSVVAQNLEEAKRKAEQEFSKNKKKYLHSDRTEYEYAKSPIKFANIIDS